MTKYEKILSSMKPSEEEIKNAIGLSFRALEEFVDGLEDSYRSQIALFIVYQIYNLRGQRKEADELKPVIEKEIDPDFFKPRAQGIIR